MQYSSFFLGFLVLSTSVSVVTAVNCKSAKANEILKCKGQQKTAVALCEYTFEKAWKSCDKGEVDSQGHKCSGYSGDMYVHECCRKAHQAAKDKCTKAAYA